MLKLIGQVTRALFVPFRKPHLHCFPFPLASKTHPLCVFLSIKAAKLRLPIVSTAISFYPIYTKAKRFHNGIYLKKKKALRCVSDVIVFIITHFPKIKYAAITRHYVTSSCFCRLNNSSTRKTHENSPCSEL
ncbi:hypothetical protein ACP275_03G020300 [Erythranthe tilingii]